MLSPWQHRHSTHTHARTHTHTRPHACRHSETQRFERKENVFSAIPHLDSSFYSLPLSPPSPSMLCPVCPYANRHLSLIWITPFLTRNGVPRYLADLPQRTHSGDNHNKDKNRLPLQCQPGFFTRLDRHIMLPANLNMLEFNCICFYCTLSNLIHEIELQQRIVWLFLLLPCTWPKQRKAAI